MSNTQPDFYFGAMPFVCVNDQLRWLLQRSVWRESTEDQEARITSSLEKAKKLLAEINNEAKGDREEFLMRAYLALDLAACLASGGNLAERLKGCGFDPAPVFRESP